MNSEGLKAADSVNLPCSSECTSGRCNNDVNICAHTDIEMLFLLQSFIVGVGFRKR